jgi:hypothetical protein
MLLESRNEIGGRRPLRFGCPANKSSDIKRPPSILSNEKNRRLYVLDGFFDRILPDGHYL